MFTKLKTYLREVWQEMGKITWPTRAELKESTLVVIVASVLVTVFIWVIDKIVGGAVDGITRLMGS